jgi:hypothetical protein
MIVAHRKHISVLTSCYGDSFTLLYVVTIRIYRKQTHTPPRPVTEIDLLSSYVDVRTSQHTYTRPRSVTGIALHFYMNMMLLLHRKHTYTASRPVRWISLVFHM